MAMTAGAVTIDDDGTEHTGADMATAIYNALKTNSIALLATFGQTIPVGAAGAAMKRGMALTANSIASGVVSYIVANAQAKIDTSTGGLQQVGGVDTTHPSPSAKFLPIV